MQTTRTRNTPSRDIDGEVGRRAHMLMWDAKLKQRHVADAMGITADGLGRKLKGERGWAVAELVTLAEVLNTSVSYLVGEVDSPTVGPAGIEPTTSTVKTGHSAEVWSITGGRVA